MEISFLSFKFAKNTIAAAARHRMKGKIMDKESMLLASENLPLDLGELGTVIEAKAVMPGVYDAVLEQKSGLNIDAFLVLKTAADISESAKKYGQPVADEPGLLIYTESGEKNPRYIIGYELFRYKILHKLPLPEDDTIRGIAACGAEMYPDYFGNYPVPMWTPWGCTTRHKVIANGLFWLETEQCQRGLAVAAPQYDDLSDGAQGLAEKFSGDFAVLESKEPPYLFFRDVDSSVPLFELLSEISPNKLTSPVNIAALMNAIYRYHPEYAAMQNMAEQSGQNDGFGGLLNSLGFPAERHISADRFVKMSPQTGTEFIAF